MFEMGSNRLEHLQTYRPQKKGENGRKEARRNRERNEREKKRKNKPIPKDRHLEVKEIKP